MEMLPNSSDKWSVSTGDRPWPSSSSSLLLLLGWAPVPVVLLVLLPDAAVVAVAVAVGAVDVFTAAPAPVVGNDDTPEDEDDDEDCLDSSVPFDELAYPAGATSGLVRGEGRIRVSVSVVPRWPTCPASANNGLRGRFRGRPGCIGTAYY